MKAKTIKSVLRKKHDEWLASIEDEGLRALVKKNTIISGGCIASMLLRENVSDYDFYFRTKEVAGRIAAYYVDRFKKNPPPSFTHGSPVDITVQDHEGRIKIVVKSAGIASESGDGGNYQYFEMIGDPNDTSANDYAERVIETVKDSEDNSLSKYRPMFMSSNAITLSNQIQLIVRFYGESDELHSNFDFVHCTNYWQSWDGELVLRPAALESLLTKELRYTGSKYPLCSIIRTRKFINRQWSINAGQFLKMAMQLHDLDLHDINVLEDQLIGVDAAYFMQVISALRNQDPEKINTAYVIEIIDRIF